MWVCVFECGTHVKVWLAATESTGIPVEVRHYASGKLNPPQDKAEGAYHHQSVVSRNE